MRTLRIVYCGLLLALAMARPVRADIAPPEQPPGSSIGTAQQTQVQMLAEQVLIEVQPAPEGVAGDSDVLARVRADFQMRNQGEADERLQVRFPLAGPSGFGSGFGDFPSVQGFTASVQEAAVPTDLITTPNPQGNDYAPLEWAAFDVTFRRGEAVNIGVTYTITATGYAPEARFGYVLETGAGWHDTIGSAEVVLRLPYAANDQNVLLQKQTTPGGEFAGNELRWQFENLEPTVADNIVVTLLAPAAWQRVQQAEERTLLRPADADAWANLARACAAAITTRYPDASNEPYLVRMQQSYEQALALAPRTADLRVEYATMLLSYLPPATLPADNPVVRQIAQQLAAALAIEPGNQAAEQLLADLRQQVAGELLLETPTAGPVATVEVIAQVPTLAPTIALTAEPTVPAADSTGTGTTRLPAGAGIVLLLVGAFGLLSLAVIMALLVLRRRRL